MTRWEQAVAFWDHTAHEWEKAGEHALAHQARTEATLAWFRHTYQEQP